MREALRGVPETQPRRCPKASSRCESRRIPAHRRRRAIRTRSSSPSADQLPQATCSPDEGSTSATRGGARRTRSEFARYCRRVGLRSDLLSHEESCRHVPKNLRRALAQEAARIMSEHGIRDFLTAKRKAAERFGVADGNVLPRNTEIEDALAEYHRLFGGDEHARRWPRSATPRVARCSCSRNSIRGSSGRCSRHRHRTQRHPAAPVRRTCRDHHLPAHGPRHRSRSRRAARALNADRVVALSGVHFEFDDHVVDATVFPVDGIRQAPVSPVDGKPMRRIDADELEVLLEGTLPLRGSATPDARGDGSRASR